MKNFLNIRGYKRRSVFWTESDDAFGWVMPRPALIPDMEDESGPGIEKVTTRSSTGCPYSGMSLCYWASFRCSSARTATRLPTAPSMCS